MRHRRLTAVVGAAAAALAVSVVAPVVTAQAATTSWVSTATKAVTYRGTALGALAANTPLHVGLILAPRHAAAMSRATGDVHPG